MYIKLTTCTFILDKQTTNNNDSRLHYALTLMVSQRVCETVVMFQHQQCTIYQPLPLLQMEQISKVNMNKLDGEMVDSASSGGVNNTIREKSNAIYKQFILCEKSLLMH